MSIYLIFLIIKKFHINKDSFKIEEGRSFVRPVHHRMCITRAICNRTSRDPEEREQYKRDKGETVDAAAAAPRLKQEHNNAHRATPPRGK